MSNGKSATAGRLSVISSSKKLENWIDQFANQPKLIGFFEVHSATGTRFETVRSSGSKQNSFSFDSKLEFRILSESWLIVSVEVDYIKQIVLPQ